MKDEIAKIIATKENLLRISDLNADKIKEMSQEQLRSYAEVLETSVNVFPIQKERTENAFRVMDYASTIQWLKAIKNILNQLHADNLVKNCEKNIEIYKDLETIRHEKFRAFIDYFLASTTMFFAEIQNLIEEAEFDEAGFSQKSQSKVIKDKLLTVSELNPAKIEALTDEQLVGYTDLLNAFYEDFSALESGLRGVFSLKQYSNLLMRLSSVAHTLSMLYADNLSEDCLSQIENNQDIASIKHEKLSIFIDYFLASVAMLCDEIRILNLPKIERQKNENLEELIEIIHPKYVTSSRSILVIYKMRILFVNLKTALEGGRYKLIGTSSSLAALDYIK